MSPLPVPGVFAWHPVGIGIVVVRPIVDTLRYHWLFWLP
jgi:hypothetical protein